jgi:S1-C subfamily serine protease
MTRSSIFVAAFVGFAITLPSFVLRAELKPEQLYASATPSVVALDVENAAGKHFVGNGFLAIDDRLAVTAWHVVHDARRVQARFADGQRVTVIGLVDKNEKSDLALLRLDRPGRPRVTLALAAPRIGSRVYLLGSPRGLDFSLSEGLVSQIRTLDDVRYYQLSCPISPGDSGGPVLNDRGEAIGVVSWRKADAENVGFAIPANEVSQLNPTLPVIAWSDAAPRWPASVRSPEAPLVRAPVPASRASSGTTYRDFQNYLAGHAGHKVTVVVQEPGKESRFSFQVPRAAAP